MNQLPISNSHLSASYISCNCSQQNDTGYGITEVSFIEAYNSYFDQQPQKCSACGRFFDFNFFVDYMSLFQQGPPHNLYAMLGAENFLFQLSLDPNKIYSFDFSKITDGKLKWLAISAHGDSGYKGAWPTIDLNYFLNPLPMYGSDRVLRIFSSYNPVSDDETYDISTLSALLTFSRTENYLNDFYLYELLVEAIKLYLNQRFDDAIVRAELAVFTKRRAIKKLARAKNLMPADLLNSLYNLRRIRGKIVHYATKPMILEEKKASKLLAAAIVGFYYYRFYEASNL